MPCLDHVLLDLIAYASSQDIDNGETRVETMHHGCGIEEVCVPSAGQEPERVKQRQEYQSVEVHSQGEKGVTKVWRAISIVHVATMEGEMTYWR